MTQFSNLSKLKKKCEENCILSKEDGLHVHQELSWMLCKQVFDCSEPRRWREQKLAPASMEVHLRMYKVDGGIRISLYGKGEYPSEILTMNSLIVNEKFMKKWTRRSSYLPRPYHQSLDDDGLFISDSGAAGILELFNNTEKNLHIRTVVVLTARGEMNNNLVAQRHICFHDYAELVARSKMISHFVKSDEKIYWGAIEAAVAPKVTQRTYRHCHTVMERFRSEPDCLLVVGDAEVPCSSPLLSILSPFFKTLFNSEFSEAKTRKVGLSCLSSMSLPKFVDFIYTGSIGEMVGRDELLELFNAAHMYQIPSLSAEVEMQLSGQLNPLILCTVLLKSIHFDSAVLKQSCIQFYQTADSREKEIILKNDDWKIIRTEYPDILEQMMIS